MTPNDDDLKISICSSWILVHCLLFFLFDVLYLHYNSLEAFFGFVALPQILLYLALNSFKPSKEFLGSVFVVDSGVLLLVLVFFIEILYSGIVEKGWGFLSYSESDESFNIYSYMILLSYLSTMFIASFARFGKGMERHERRHERLKSSISQQTKAINSLRRENKKYEIEIKAEEEKILELSNTLIKIEDRILGLEKDIPNEKKIFATLRKKYPFLSSGKIIGDR